MADSAPQSLEPKLLAYVDILGSKERIANDVVSAVKAVGVLHAVAKFDQDRKEEFSKGGLAFGETLHTSTFSDTIVFSCKPNTDDAGVLLWNVQMLCVFLLMKGNYTRGAITLDGLLHQQSTIVGKALIEAHALEQQIAVYPRIVVTDTAAELLKSTRINSRTPKGPCQLRRDFDDLPTLDIFGFMPNGMRSRDMHARALGCKAIVEVDLAHTREVTCYPSQVVALNHRAKYAWMLAYLEKVLSDPIDPATDGQQTDPVAWP